MNAPPLNFGAKVAKAVDSLVGVFSPSAAESRMAARDRMRMRLTYDGGRPSRQREDAPFLRGPDSPMHQVQSVAMMSRGQDLLRNDGFIHAIVGMFQTYVVGDLHYIPNVGTRAENEAYRAYIDEWMYSSDKMGRFHYVDQIKMAIGGYMINGLHGQADFHNEDGTYQIQDVTGDSIGNPRQRIISNYYVQGIVLDENRRPVAVRLFRRTINDMYEFVAEIPLGIFTLYNPVETPDEIRAKSVFHPVMDSAQDMKELERAWKFKIKMASKKAIVHKPPNGMGPNGSELDRDFGDATIRGKVTQMADGEEIIAEPGYTLEFPENNSPTSNEQEAVANVLGKITAGVDLPLQFLWLAMGMTVPGTMTRQISKRAERTFVSGRLGQQWLTRVALRKQITNALFSGMIRGDIPHTSNWSRGNFMFPAHPSTDEGNDTDADLKELAQGVKSRAEICARGGRFIGDVDDEIDAEAQGIIQRAVDIANNLNTKNPSLKITWRDTINYVMTMSPNAKSPGDLVAPVNDETGKTASAA